MRHTATILRVFVIGLLLLLSAGWPGTVSARFKVWTTHGPEGGAIRTLAIDPMTSTQPSISALSGRVAFISDGDLLQVGSNDDYNPEVYGATFRTGSDVAVQKTSSADLVTAGEPLIYTIAVRNNLGPAVRTVVLTDTLTTAVDVVKGAPVLPAGVSCEPWTGDSIRCVIGSIEVSDTVIFTLSIMPIQAGVITNTVQVFALGDPFPDNNEDTVVLWPYRLHLPLILRAHR